MCEHPWALKAFGKLPCRQAVFAVGISGGREDFIADEEVNQSSLFKWSWEEEGWRMGHPTSQPRLTPQRATSHLAPTSVKRQKGPQTAEGDGFQPLSFDCLLSVKYLSGLFSSPVAFPSFSGLSFLPFPLPSDVSALFLVPTDSTPFSWNSRCLCLRLLPYY